MTQRSPVPDWFGTERGPKTPPPLPGAAPKRSGGGTGCLGFSLGMIVAIAAVLYALTERHRAERYRARVEELEETLEKRANAEPPPRAVEPPPAPPQPVAPSEPEPGDERDARQVSRVLRSLQPQLRACYENALTYEPSAEGKITVTLKIASDGSVTSTSADTTGNLPAPVARCVTAVVKTAKFAPSTSETSVTYPVVFQGGN